MPTVIVWIPEVKEGGRWVPEPWSSWHATRGSLNDATWNRPAGSLRFARYERIKEPLTPAGAYREEKRAMCLA